MVQEQHFGTGMDRQQFLNMLPKNGIIAEIGVATGTHALDMYTICKPKELYLIDSWTGTDYLDEYDGNIRYAQVERMFRNCPNVILLRETSMKAVKRFKDRYFDWVYIDAVHIYENVKQDMNAWWSKVKSYLCGHDYIDYYIEGYGQFGVIQAVNEFIKENNLDPPILSDAKFRDWAIRRKD